MEYFELLSELTGTGYFEFQKGIHEKLELWKEDSVYLSAFSKGAVMLNVFKECVEGFDIYSPVNVTAEDWDKIKKTTAEKYPQYNDYLEELREFLEPDVYEAGGFTFLGI